MVNQFYKDIMDEIYIKCKQYGCKFAKSKKEHINCPVKSNCAIFMEAYNKKVNKLLINAKRKRSIVIKPLEEALTKVIYAYNKSNELLPFKSKTIKDIINNIKYVIYNYPDIM